MALEIFTFDQNSNEWLRARMGIPTASEFATVMASGRGGGESKTRRTYMLKLLGERMTGEPSENFTTQAMERGHEMEQEARDAYCFMTGNDFDLVGFMRNGEKGASPDALIEDNGLLEIKTKVPHRHLDALLRDEVPSEHIAQIQGQIWISEREWCDFISYWPKLDPFIKRVYRDDVYIKKMSDAVDRFVDELLELEAKLTQPSQHIGNG